jgi:hypothetical protein
MTCLWLEGPREFVLSKFRYWSLLITGLLYLALGIALILGRRPISAALARLNSSEPLIK